jgi:hypothetical protein
MGDCLPQARLWQAVVLYIPGEALFYDSNYIRHLYDKVLYTVQLNL